MKKVLTLVAVAGMFSFYACGPSAEEIAAKEKASAQVIRGEALNLYNGDEAHFSHVFALIAPSDDIEVQLRPSAKK